MLFNLNYFINKSFDYEYTKIWINNQLPLFILIIIFYILFVKLFSNKNKKIIKNTNFLNKILFLWNLFLALFSFFGFIRITPLMLIIIKKYGIISKIN
jgi:hypothetical protein